MTEELQEKWALKTNLDDALDLIDAYKKRIAELEAQIEKMKCCQNCKHCTESVSYKARDGKEKSKICSYGNYWCNKWEIKEK